MAAVLAAFIIPGAVVEVWIGWPYGAGLVYCIQWHCSWARTWVSDRLIQITIFKNTSPPLLLPNWRSVSATVVDLFDRLHYIQPPPDP